MSGLEAACLSSNQRFLNKFFLWTHAHSEMNKLRLGCALLHTIEVLSAHNTSFILFLQETAKPISSYTACTPHTALLQGPWQDTGDNLLLMGWV